MLLVLGSPLSKMTKIANIDIIQMLMPDDTTTGEGGHIPPYYPFG